jgi:hypothetical protein
MFNATGLSQAPICPKCRRVNSLELRAGLPEADGFPQVHCLECSSCGEVLVVELGLGERYKLFGDGAVRIAA